MEEIQTKEINKSVFEVLSAIDVSSKVQKKEGMSYLPWAYAWGTLKKHYPDSTYNVYKNEEGKLYHSDSTGCWVEVGVTVEGLEHIEYFPVFDPKMKTVKMEGYIYTVFDKWKKQEVEKKVKPLDSMIVNKSIQRALTKAIARHGLGLYIYAGEDLPVFEKEVIDPEAEIKKIQKERYRKRLQEFGKTEGNKAIIKQALFSLGIERPSQVTEEEFFAEVEAITEEEK